ncbi:unnamed protein product [Spirodela intermedia]|uniref:Uncharacterized protein n=2 Tax=Spirodela intermedia TaxID=51605 RepID=A0A7I8IPC8_SPIIN|nr:unnamed protein product [Spirodela intermedia]CAA6659002.1 unnamed protein product [Spirodela intermedia]CAA7395289.1 unnamed protein product [Spirodela intermedia]
MLREEMNDLVDDIVGVQLEPSSLRFMLLLLLLYTSEWRFMCCCCCCSS